MFPFTQVGVVGLREEDPTGKTHIVTMTDHLAQVVTVRFLHCTVTLSPRWRDVTRDSLGGAARSPLPSLRVECLTDTVCDFTPGRLLPSPQATLSLLLLPPVNRVLLLPE